jgi:hypothetical protein
MTAAQPGIPAVAADRAVPARRAKRATLGRTAAAAGILLLLYAFMRDNAAMDASAGGESWVRFSFLPPQKARFVELGVVALLVARAALRLRLADALVGLACAGFVFVSAASYLHAPLVRPLDAFRLIYAYILPAALFFAVATWRWDPRALRAVRRFLFGWIGVSAAVSWYQFLVLKLQIGDAITGLNQDAHVNASLMVIAALLLFADALFLRQYLKLLPMIGLGVSAVLPSDLRAMAVSPALFGVVLALYARGLSRARLRVLARRVVAGAAAALVLLLVLWKAFSAIDTASFERLPDIVDRLQSNPATFGPVVAYGMSADVLTSSVPAFFLGTGPFSYANPISYGDVKSEGPFASYARRDLVPGAREHGEDARVNLATAIATELGLPAFWMLVAATAVMLWRLYRCTRSAVPLVRATGAGVTASVLFIFGLGLVGMFGSLTSLSLSWPVVILAGGACRVAERRS